MFALTLLIMAGCPALNPENPVTAVVSPCGVMPGLESAQLVPLAQFGPTRSSYVDAEKFVFSKVIEGAARIAGQ